METSASAANNEKEPSMEEILQSIREIIADDGDGANQTKAANGVEEDVPGSDVLELTEMLAEDGSVVSLKNGAAAPDSGDILNTIDAALAKEKPPAATTIPTIDAQLLSDEAANSAAAAIQRLRTIEDGLPGPQVASHAFRSGNTLEDLMMEMLRPMLKEWLDNNLPAVVEHIVEREVHKLTRR